MSFLKRKESSGSSGLGSPASPTGTQNFFSRHSHAKEIAAVPTRVSAWGDEPTSPGPGAGPSTPVRNITPTNKVSAVQTQAEAGQEFMRDVNYQRMSRACDTPGAEVVVAQEESDDDEDGKGTGAIGVRRPTGYGGTGPGVVGGAGGAAKQLLEVRMPQSNHMVEFLLTPIPVGQQLLCHIKRNTKGGIKNKMFPRFVLNLDKGAEFLMGAKKRKKNKTANYLISRDSAVKKQSDLVLGKVRSNFFGTEFLLYDNGKNPKKSGGGEARMELATVTYAQNVQGNGPRKMQIVIPQVQRSGEVAKFTDGEESLLARLKDGSKDSVHQGRNKLPKWDSERNCFTMDFGGRVTMASVKNFQVVLDEHDDHVVLQFGRAGKDVFNVDVRWPMSPFQAFGICLTSLDSKIACE